MTANLHNTTNKPAAQQCENHADRAEPVSSTATAMPNASQRRHITFGGAVCIILLVAMTVIYCLSSHPMQRLSQRYADSAAPVLYEYTFEIAGDDAPVSSGKIVVESSEFEYTGIDTLRNIGEYYRDIDTDPQLSYSLVRLDDANQPHGAAARNTALYYLFLLLPWAIYLTVLTGYQLISYRTHSAHKKEQ